MVLAYLAADIALRGGSPSKADSQGVLSEVSKQPAGPALLALLAAGLAAYGLWRLAQCFDRSDAGSTGASPWKRIGWAGTALIYFGLCSQAISLIVGSGSKGGPSSHPTPFVAAVLRHSGGPALVGLVGGALGIGGVALAVWACVHDFDNVLQSGRMSRPRRKVAHVAGRIGDVTRGSLVALVSVYLVTAALTDDPRHVKSLGGSLQGLVRYSFGPALLALIAFGLAMFAVYSFFESAYHVP